MTGTLGYAFLRERLGIRVPDIAYPAIQANTRILERGAYGLRVPEAVAPQTDSLLDHLTFALKHEGTNLAVLSEALPEIPAEDLQAALRRTPNSVPLRIAGFLWEHFARKTLEDIPAVTTSSTPLFDPQQYLTATPEDPRKAGGRNRWRVQQNGLGSLEYLVTVRKTPEITALLEMDLLAKTRAWMQDTDPMVLDRIVSWAYLSETKSSFAIEKENLPHDKAQRFVALLQKALSRESLRQPFTEELLCNLQNNLIQNPLDTAFRWRTTQNWLQNGLRGPLGISYLPPPPSLLPTIMQEIGSLADTLANRTDPLVAASVVSFAFVLAHPFLDGNGRLSRLLFHRTLSQAQALPESWVLPVSMAMQRREREYLRALQTFSRPAREFWEVSCEPGTPIEARFTGSDSLYLYWDATAMVEFALRMAQEALEKDLQQESRFLTRFDAMEREVRSQIDLQQPIQTFLIQQCLENGGTISKNCRKQYCRMVPEETFAIIERAWSETLPAEEMFMETGKEEEPVNHIRDIP